MDDALTLKWFNEHSPSEICFAARCWFSCGLWNYWHEFVASRFGVGFRCCLLGYSDYCFCGSSSPLVEPCSGDRPCLPCRRRCVGCCSFRISSVAEQSGSGLPEGHSRWSCFVLDSSQQSALCPVRKCCFVHSDLHLESWFEMNSWSCSCVRHDVEAGLEHRPSRAFASADDE